MRRTIFFLILAMLTLVLSLTACGETAVTTTEGTTTTEPAVTTTEPVETTTEAPAKKDPVVSPTNKAINVYTAFEAKVFEATNGLDLPYRIYVPADYSEEYAYPVVLFLHGAGERGTDNRNQLNNVIPNLYKNKQSPFYQSIVIVPQCPNDAQWVDTPWGNGSYSVRRVPLSQPLEAAIELLDSVIETYSVNLNRQYIMGISMGGYGTWDALMRNPDRFAAAIPICGAADPTYASKLKDIPIKAFHDSTDDIVPVSGTRDIVRAIENAGGTLITYDEPAQYGHGVWDYATNNQEVLNWLFEQRKVTEE